MIKKSSIKSISDCHRNCFFLKKGKYHDHPFDAHNVIGQAGCYYFCHMTYLMGVNSTCEAKG